MGDGKRPTLAKGGKFPTERLEGVLSLLLQSQKSPEKTIASIDEAISTVVSRQRDCTAECLVQARNSLNETLQAGTPHARFTLDDSTSACLSRRRAVGYYEELVTSPQALRTEFERLMRVWRYDIVRQLTLQHGWGELDSDGNTFIYNLV